MEYLTSPLRRYIRQILENNLSKFISHINLEALGLGGDVILSNLELKLDAIQDLLSIPLAFVVSFGNIKDLRIHIPWTHLLSQPIEIRLANVEIVLIARNELDYRRLQLEYTKRNMKKSENLNGNSGQHENQELKDILNNENESNNGKSDSQSQENKKKKINKQQNSGEEEVSWLQSTLRKVLGNVSLVIENLVLKYEHDNVVLSTSIESISVFSANPNEGWLKGFQEPIGIFQVLGKCISVNGLTINLERVSTLTATSSSSTPPTLPTHSQHTQHTRARTISPYRLRDQAPAKDPICTGNKTACVGIRFQGTRQTIK